MPTHTYAIGAPLSLPPIYALAGGEPSVSVWSWATDRALVRLAEAPEHNYNGGIDDFGGWSFVRTGEATCWTAQRVLETVASGVWRRQHDLTTGDDLGILVEESRTNVALNSANMSWLGASDGTSSWEATALVAPDGVNTWMKLARANPMNNGAYRYRTNALPESGDFALSMFLRRYEVEMYAKFPRVEAFAQGNFSVRSDALEIANVGTGVTWTGLDLGDDFARIAMAGVVNATYNHRSIILANVNTSTLGGTNASNLGIGEGNDFFGIQMESGTTLSLSYIPTAGSPVTRPADDAEIALLPEQVNDAGMILRVRGRTAGGIGGDPQVYATALNSGDPDTYAIIERETDQTMRARAMVGGVAQADLDLGELGNGEPFDVQFAMKDGLFSARLNGGAPASIESGSAPTGIDTLLVGRDMFGFYANSPVRDITLIPRPPTDASDFGDVP